MKIYVIIIGRAENVGVGIQHPAASTGTDRDALIRKAIQERAQMERKSGNTYDIFVGEITAKVSMPIEYTLETV